MGWEVDGGWVVGGLMGWVGGGGVVGWRVHGMGGGGVGGWRIHRTGAYTHPPMNSYNVKIFNLMNTHPPTHQTYPKCYSVTIHILWRVHGMVVVGWLEGSLGEWVGDGVGGWRFIG